MTPRRVRYSKISELTAGLLKRFGIAVPPIPIADLLKDCGVELKFGDLGDVSGLIARKGRQAIVGVNLTHASTRQRFTMAHELGHFLLHQDLKSHSDVSFRVKYRDRKSSEATDLEEIEANFFAASLLMRRSHLDALGAAEALDDDDEVTKLAKRFEVSSHAMSLRLVNLYGSQRPF